MVLDATFHVEHAFDEEKDNSLERQDGERFKMSKINRH